jgi:hypothetical protein
LWRPAPFLPSVSEHVVSFYISPTILASSSSNTIVPFPVQPFIQQDELRLSLYTIFFSVAVMIPTFLQIPVEIRDRIYLSVLRQENISTASSQSRTRSKSPREPYCPSFLSYQVDALPGIVSTLGLLSSCHQIRAELQQALIREDLNERKKPIFKLDCKMERHLISPTWITLPTSLAAAHRLEINIRVRYMRWSDTGHFIVLFPRVFELLHRLFNHGPHFYHRSYQPLVSIHSLTLKFYDEVTKTTDQNQDDRIADIQQNQIQRIEQCLLGLDRYGLLKGRVKTIDLQHGTYRKEIHINNNADPLGQVKPASSSEWLAWKYRWRKDDMAHYCDT